MQLNFSNKKAVVEYVSDLLDVFGPDWPLTMTITRGKSGAYSAHIVTDTSWEDTEHQTARFFSETQVNT